MPSNNNRREALRAQQEAAAKAARNRKMVGIGAGIVALVLVVVLIVVLTNQKSSDPTAAVTPPNAVTNTYGVAAGQNPNNTPDGIAIYKDAAKPGAPTVQLFADYQCPGCKAFDDAFGETLNGMAKSGDIKYSIQMETFLDRFGANKSTDPAIAAACADTVGKFPEYHLMVYKNQPSQEGAGYTVDQLRNQFATQSGISGEDLTKFQKCFDNRQTETFVKGENQFNTAWTTYNYAKLGGQSEEAKSWGSTPQITVNGKRLDMTGVTTSNPASLGDAIKKAAAQG